jgi:hypothetical protein
VARVLAILAAVLAVVLARAPAAEASYQPPRVGLENRVWGSTPDSTENATQIARQACECLEAFRLLRAGAASGSVFFLQRDPAGYVDSVNLYAGFANDPVNMRDPTGEQSVPPSLDPRQDRNAAFRTGLAFALPAAKVLAVLSDPRIAGPIQIVGGILECGGVLALMAAPIPGSRGPGAVAIVHCIDTVAAGVRTVASGQVKHTVTHQAGVVLCGSVGVSEGASNACGVLADLTVGLGPQFWGWFRLARGVTVFRVQGGVLPNASKVRVFVDESGRVLLEAKGGLSSPQLRAEAAGSRVSDEEARRSWLRRSPYHVSHPRFLLGETSS